jgi:hypothetical protein
VDEEWRVSLVARGAAAGGRLASANAVCKLLRARVGEEATVTAGKAGVVFLYAATADAAVAAEGMAREALARRGLAADVRLDQWDPSRRAWVPPGDAAAAGLPPEQEDDPGSRRRRAAGAVVVAIIEGIGHALAVPGGCSMAGPHALACPGGS